MGMHKIKSRMKRAKPIHELGQKLEAKFDELTESVKGKLASFNVDVDGCRAREKWQKGFNPREMYGHTDPERYDFWKVRHDYNTHRLKNMNKKLNYHRNLNGINETTIQFKKAINYDRLTPIGTHYADWQWKDTSNVDHYDENPFHLDVIDIPLNSIITWDALGTKSYYIKVNGEKQDITKDYIVPQTAGGSRITVELWQSHWGDDTKKNTFHLNVLRAHPRSLTWKQYEALKADYITERKWFDALSHPARNWKLCEMTKGDSKKIKYSQNTASNDKLCEITQKTNADITKLERLKFFPSSW